MKTSDSIAIDVTLGNAEKMRADCLELAALFTRSAEILSSYAQSVPSDKSQTSEKPRRPGKASVLTEEQEARFARFWAVYPRKESKPDAREAWKKINPDDVLTDKIIVAVKAAKLCDSRFRELRFTPHTATWLNNAGWENEYDTANNMKSYDSDEFFEAALRRGREQD
jgi:hypothetical protein